MLDGYMTKIAWNLAYRNLLRQRRRSVGAACALAVAVAGLTLVKTYKADMETRFHANAVLANRLGDLALFKPGGSALFLRDPVHYGISLSEQKLLLPLLNAQSDVAFFGRYIWAMGFISNGCEATPFYARGIDPDVEPYIYNHPLAAMTQLFASGATAKPFTSKFSTPISITPLVAEILEKSQIASTTTPGRPPIVNDCADAKDRGKIRESPHVVLSSLTTSGNPTTIAATVVAHHHDENFFRDHMEILAPTMRLQELLGTQTLAYVAVFLKPGAAPSAVTNLTERIRAAGLDLVVLPALSEELSPRHAGMIRWMNLVETLVTGLIELTVTLLLVSFFSSSISARHQEIGTMLVVGFMPGRIERMILCEILLLTVLGLALGGFISVGVTKVLNIAAISYLAIGLPGVSHLHLALAPSLFLYPMLLTGTTAIVTAYIAIRWQTRRNSLTSLLYSE